MRLSYQEIETSYDQIKRSACGRQACSVMILVANEVDAMAATRMLTQLLRIDNIAYVVRPVTNFSQVLQNFRSYVTTEIKTIILINCGAMHNIPKAFELEQGGDTRCFIMDNHRPFHLANVHSRHNVVVFDDLQEMEEDQHNQVIPSDGSDLSGDSDGDDTSEEDDDEADADEAEENVFSDGEEEEEFQEGDGDVSKEEIDEGDDEEAETGEGGDNDDKADGDDKIDTAATEDKGYEGGDDDTAAAHGLGGDDDEDDVVARADGVSDDRRLSEATSNEDDDEENSDTDRATKSLKPRRDVDVMGGEGSDEDEEMVRVVGRRRKALEELHDPARVRRRRVNEYYVRPAGYSFPTAMMIMNLVWGRNGSHVPLDLVWQAVLGTTDQYHRARIDHNTYTSICQYLTVLLGEHLTSAAERVRYVVGDGTEEEVVAQGAETGHIQEIQEFRFFMHRHWSLFDSMYHSPYIASKMPIWQQHGTLKLQELLAKMGMPLDQCKRQSYNTIRADLRPHLKQQLLNDKEGSVQDEYKLKNPDIMYQSFSRYNSFKNPIGASDMVFAATSLLEMCRSDDIVVDHNHSNGDVVSSSSSGISRQQAFNDAYDCLGTGARAEELLRKGVQASLVLQRSLVKKAAVMLEGHDSISRLNRLYFAYVHQAAYLTGGGGVSDGGAASTSSAALAAASSSSSGNSASGSGAASASASNHGGGADFEMDAPFSRPHVLTRLGQFIMEVKRNLPKKQGGWSGRKGLLPLILIAEKRESYLVVGISPLSTAQGMADLTEQDQHAISQLTNFRQFFRLACKELRIQPLSESFDANVIEVAREDVQDFLGTLDFLLKKATPDYLRI